MATLLKIPRRLTAVIYIKNRRVEFLVDTGSTLTIINGNWVRDASLNDKIVHENSTVLGYGQSAIGTIVGTLRSELVNRPNGRKTIQTMSVDTNEYACA